MYSKFSRGFNFASNGYKNICVDQLFLLSKQTKVKSRNFFNVKIFPRKLL